MTVQIFYNLLNQPTFRSEETLVNLVRRRECFVGLSILLVYGVVLTNLFEGQVVDMAAPHIDDLQEREALEELSEETGIWDL